MLVLLRPPLAILALVTALAGCAATTAPSHPSAARSPIGVGASHVAQPRTGAVSPDITLAFAGDVNFARRTRKLLRHPASAFGPVSPVLGSADFTAVNLETAVTSRGTPQPKQFHFRTTGKAFSAIRAAGIDLVTMANNHVLDYGQTGLRNTLAAAKAARFPYVGIGMNARAAWAPYITTIKGTRIAIIGTLAAVRAVRKHADVVIVFMHWGTEGQACPDVNQRALAPRLARAGASIIIGAHAHTLQGSGWLHHTFVAYGMGNFLWWERSYGTATGVLKLTLRPHGRPLIASFLPAVVSATGQPVPLHGARARRAARSYASLRSCTGLSARPSS